MGRLSRELLGGGEPAPKATPAPAPAPKKVEAKKDLKGEGIKTESAESLGSKDE